MNRETPVVFIHGNGSSSDVWDDTVQYLYDHGYGSRDIWTIDFDQTTPTHPEMAEQLDRFVHQVKDATGAEKVDIVGHSLGVTGARWWMLAKDGHKDVESFIGIAGANHGITFATWACRFGIAYGIWKSSCFIRADYDSIENHPLRVLNRNETFGDVEYYTIRGTRDKLYSLDPDSPKICGATNYIVNETHRSINHSEDTFKLLDHALQS